MQREVFTQTKTLKLRNPFKKQIIKVENNRAILETDCFYTDELGNNYYCFSGDGVFNKFDKTKNLTPLNLDNFYALNKADIDLLDTKSSIFALLDLDIDKKYYEKLEQFILERIKNAR